MTFEDLVKLYEQKRKIYGDKAYLHVSDLFAEIREEYKQEYLRGPRARTVRASGGTPDAEQSWKPFKGHNFEKLIMHIVRREIESLGVGCIQGQQLERVYLPNPLDQLYRNLLVRFGPFAILPDADLVIYEPDTARALGVISCKTSLRERVAQTAYWKLKLSADPITTHVKGYFVTLDEDHDLAEGLQGVSSRKPGRRTSKRNRIIVEHELDGTYVLGEVVESDRVKGFPRLLDDVRRLVNG